MDDELQFSFENDMTVETVQSCGPDQPPNPYTFVLTKQSIIQNPSLLIQQPSGYPLLHSQMQTFSKSGGSSSTQPLFLQHSAYLPPQQSSRQSASSLFNNNTILTMAPSLSQQQLQSEIEGLLALRSRDWNEEFNYILSSSPLHERSALLTLLSREFVMTAQKVGEQIIRDNHLPYNSKLFKPLQNSGMAGGEKYLEKGIFFKFAINKNALFASEEGAAKVAGHELKGHTALVSCGMSLGLQFGLMTIVDFRGSRLLASSYLPITNETLVYGSSDGGKTVRDSDEEMSHLIETCAQVLNLKGHVAGIGPLESRKYLHAPCDMEGHIGLDGRFYLVDLARLFPPETPQKDVPGSFLFRLLRPELVRRFYKPLSPDAFTLFGEHDHLQHDAEVQDATSWLRDVVIRDFCFSMTRFSLPDQPSEPLQAPLNALLWLVDVMHKSGINLRYLGKIRTDVFSTKFRTDYFSTEAFASATAWHRLILTEMAARVIKQNLKEKMRKLPHTSDLYFRSLIVDYLNSTILCDTESSRAFFCTSLGGSLRSEIATRFADGLFHDESGRSNVDLRTCLFIPILLDRLLSLSGITSTRNWIAEGLYQEEPTTNRSIVRSLSLPGLRPLVIAEIPEVKPISKQMYILPRIEADTAAELARRTSDPLEAKQLLTSAAKKYQETLELKPDDYFVLSNLGSVVTDLGRLENELNEATLLFNQAHKHFHQSISIKPDDLRSLTMAGEAFIHHSLSIKFLQSFGGISSADVGKQMMQLLARAIDFNLTAEQIQTGAGSLNLARICAIQGKEEQCLGWLVKAQKFGFLPEKHLLVVDFGLMPVSNRVWFQEFLLNSNSMAMIAT